MTFGPVTMTIRPGGVDDAGYHRVPRSRCCGTALVVMAGRHTAYRYVPVESDGVLADFLRVPGHSLRCGRCNADCAPNSVFPQK